MNATGNTIAATNGYTLTTIVTTSNTSCVTTSANSILNTSHLLTKKRSHSEEVYLTANGSCNNYEVAIKSAKLIHNTSNELCV